MDTRETEQSIFGASSETASEQVAETKTETTTEAPAPMVDPSAPEAPPAGPSELDMLKNRARLMGVTFSNNIGLEALRARVDAKMNDEPDVPEVAPVAEVNALAADEPAAFVAPVIKKSPEQLLREEIIAEQMKLVRLRITCMDPKKKDLPGEIFTIANEYLGTVRKFIPFGEVTDEGFHVPYCLYTMLKEREFLNIRIIKDRRTGQSRTESNYTKEFALEILPQLTQAELDRLAAAQIAAGSLDSTLG